VAQLVRAHSVSLGLDAFALFTSALKGYAAMVPGDRIASLEADPSVRAVYPDLESHANAQTVPTGVSRIGATPFESLGPRPPVDGSGVDVAVIDTGLGPFVPDLDSKLGGTKDCLYGLVPWDLNGHGTNVAGIIAAADDSDGVVGVAPGARLWPISALDFNGRGFLSQAICAVNFVDANSPARGGPIKVANMSLGFDVLQAEDGNCGRTNGDPLHTAICQAVADGVTFTVAAGNDATDIQRATPAGYREVITVSALADSDGQPCGLGPGTRFGPDDTFARFSNFAASDADRAHMLAAPGVDILSDAQLGGLRRFSGTSQAAPHVAGAAARFIQLHPGSTPAQVLAGLKAGAEELSSTDGCTGGATRHSDPTGQHPEAVVRADSL
jgi:subtilisin family serine protease